MGPNCLPWKSGKLGPGQLGPGAQLSGTQLLNQLWTSVNMGDLRNIKLLIIFLAQNLFWNSMFT